MPCTPGRGAALRPDSRRGPTSPPAGRARAAARSTRRRRSEPAPSSIELPQIEAGVEGGNFGVAVEHERLAPQQLSDATFPGLAPARVIHVRVDVRVEAVLDPAAVLVPGGGRLGFLQLDLDDDLRRLEAILPRHDQPD